MWESTTGPTSRRGGTRIVRHHTEDGIPTTGRPSRRSKAPPGGLCSPPQPTGLHAPVEGSGRRTAWALIATLGGFAAVSIGLPLRLGAARAQDAALSRTDELTGLPNRRAMTDALDRAIGHSRRHAEPVASGLIDLDHFKSINDTYGHETGDLVLAAVSQALRAVTRDDDLAGRWGGEEFIVILTGADHGGALVAAERIRQAVSDATLPPAMAEGRRRRASGSQSSTTTTTRSPSSAVPTPRSTTPKPPVAIGSSSRTSIDRTITNWLSRAQPRDGRARPESLKPYENLGGLSAARRSDPAP